MAPKEKKMVTRFPTPEEKRKSTQIIHTSAFQKALENVPQADIDLVKNQRATLSDEQIIQALVRNRWNHKICDACGDKQQPNKLKHCARCCLAFYCSVECQKKGWKEHKTRCGNKQGPLDNGFQKLVFCDKKVLELNEKDKKELQAGQEIRFQPPAAYNSIRLPGDIMDKKQEMDDLFQDPQNICKLIESAEKNNFFAKQLASIIKPQIVLLLVFPNILSILRTLKREWTKDHPAENDKCETVILKKEEALKEFPSAILGKMTLEDWGVIIASCINIRMPNGSTQERIGPHQIACYRI